MKPRWRKATPLFKNTNKSNIKNYQSNIMTITTDMSLFMFEKIMSDYHRRLVKFIFYCHLLFVMKCNSPTTLIHKFMPLKNHLRSIKNYLY